MSDYNPDIDPRSSNSLIRAYLASKQMQPGNPNFAQAVRTALSANAASPGTIPGLVNSTPSTEADDQAAMAAARGRHGIGGNSGARPLGPVNGPPVPTGGASDTSAAPGADDGSGMPLWQQILAGAATGLGFVGGSKLRGRGGAPEPGVGEPGQPDIRLRLNGPEVPGQSVGVGGDPGTLRLGGPGTEPAIPGVAQPRLLPGAAAPGQLSGPDAQFQVGGPEQPKLLTGPSDTRPVADPNVAIAAPRPEAPEVIELPKPRVRVAAGSAEPQITDTVPAIDEAGARVKKPGRARASRARVPARL